MRRQLGLYVNQQYCTGCKTCQIACKDKHDNEVGVNFLRVTEHSGGGFTEAGGTCQADAWAYWIPVACNHCDIPRCVEACPTGAIRKSRVDGTMSIDQESCSGCGACLDSCPYGAPQYSEKKGKVLICDLCADYRAEGKDPACVAACPMRVIEWGLIDELKKEHPEAITALQGLPDPVTTGPNTIYTPHRHALLRLKLFTRADHPGIRTGRRCLSQAGGRGRGCRQRRADGAQCYRPLRGRRRRPLFRSAPVRV